MDRIKAFCRIASSRTTGGRRSFRRGIQRTLHYDDHDRIDLLRGFLREERVPDIDTIDEQDRRRLSALLLTLRNPRKNSYDSLNQALADLWRHEAVRLELMELLDILEEQIVHLSTPLDLLHRTPLQVHATYRQEEILSAFGVSTVTNPARMQPAFTSTSNPRLTSFSSPSKSPKNTIPPLPATWTMPSATTCFTGKANQPPRSKVRLHNDTSTTSLEDPMWFYSSGPPGRMNGIAPCPISAQEPPGTSNIAPKDRFKSLGASTTGYLEMFSPSIALP